MKVRSGFVSNSSSSSFIVRKSAISAEQMDKIYSHDEKVDREYDIWDIEDLGNKIRLSTHMDNFDMEECLEDIGVPRDAISYEW